MFTVQQTVRQSYYKQFLTISLRCCSNQSTHSPSSTTLKKEEKSTDSKQKEISVAGLSSKVLSVPSHEVGSGASKNGKYKNPEYFCYNKESYFDAEIEMLKYRLPQPAAK